MLRSGATIAGLSRVVTKAVLPADLRVGLIYEQIRHFGGHSGWEAAVPHLQPAVACERLEPSGPLMRLSHTKLDLLVKPAGMPWYSLGSPARELAAARMLRSKQGAICHFLYAEGAYHSWAECEPRAAGRGDESSAPCTSPLVRSSGTSDRTPPSISLMP